MCIRDRFKDGRIIDFDAKMGKEVLKEMLSIDEGSPVSYTHLAVPYDNIALNSWKP